MVGSLPLGSVCSCSSKILKQASGSSLFKCNELLHSYFYSVPAKTKAIIVSQVLVWTHFTGTVEGVEWAPEAIKFSKSYGSHLIALTRYIFKFGSHIFLFLQSDASRPFQKLFSNFVLPTFLFLFPLKTNETF